MERFLAQGRQNKGKSATFWGNEQKGWIEPGLFLLLPAGYDFQESPYRPLRRRLDKPMKCKFHHRKLSFPASSKHHTASIATGSKRPPINLCLSLSFCPFLSSLVLDAGLPGALFPVFSIPIVLFCQGKITTSCAVFLKKPHILYLQAFRLGGSPRKAGIDIALLALSRADGDNGSDSQNQPAHSGSRTLSKSEEGSKKWHKPGLSMKSAPGAIRKLNMVKVLQVILL